MFGLSYRWYVVAVSMVVFMLTVGTTYSSFGLYVLPVSKDLGLSRADMNSALILMNIGVALTAPAVGRLLDRVSPRLIMMISSVMLGLSLAALGLSESLLVSSAVLVVPLAISFQSAGTLTMTVFIARWFEADRGRAIALAMTGMSFGAILVAPAIGFLIHSLGWRTTLILVGSFTGALLLLLSFTMRDGPEAATGGAAKAAAPPAQPTKIGVLLRSPMFWMIALPISLTLGMSTAITISLVPLAQQNGLSMLQVTSLISAMGVAGIAGKLILVAIDGKADRVWTLVALMAIGVLINAALLFSDTYVALLGCGIALGVALGAVTPAYLALAADRFGSATFGTIQGLVGLLISLLGLLGVRIAGEVFDRTGGYDMLFAVFLVLQIAATALMIGVRFLRVEAPTPAPSPAAV